MSRKRKLHYCKYHPIVHTNNQCVNCKAFICKECLLVFKGKSYCASNCIPRELQKSSSTLLPLPQKQIHGKSLFGWSSCTLALCALVFTAWTLQEIKVLQNENIALQNNRSILLSQLKQTHTTEENTNEAKTFEREITEIYDEMKAIEKNDKRTQKKQSKPKKTVFKPLPPLTNTANNLINGPVDIPQVALTFDGGSIANAALDIVDTLRSRNVHSTVFLTGHFIRKYPEIVTLLLQENHEIGNHTYSHPHLTNYEQTHIHSTLPNITPEVIQRELTKTDDLYFSITGARLARIWRGPYGEYNPEICAWAKQAGYHHIGWRRGKTWSQNLDSNDWIPDRETPGFKTPDEVLTKIISLAKTKPYGINGGIILLHLGTLRENREDQVHLKLGIMIDSLRTLGYSLVPISQMLNEHNNS